MIEKTLTIGERKIRCRLCRAPYDKWKEHWASVRNEWIASSSKITLPRGKL